MLHAIVAALPEDPVEGGAPSSGHLHTDGAEERHLRDVQDKRHRIHHRRSHASTRADDFSTLRLALVRHLTAGGSENDLPSVPAFVSTHLGSYISLGGTDTGGLDASLDVMWPRGEEPPFIWLATPTRYQRLGRSRVNCSTRRNNFNLDPQLEPLVHFGAVAWTIVVNGVPYLCGRYRTSLPRPVDDPANQNESALRFQFRYASPPPAPPVVTQVT